MAITSMKLVWFALYLPDTKQHVGNLKFELQNGVSWTYNPNPRNGLFTNHPFCFPHGGNVSKLNGNYELKEAFGGNFGTFDGFSLAGFDTDLKYQLVTNTFGSFDAYFIPSHLYSHINSLSVASTQLFVGV